MTFPASPSPQRWMRPRHTLRRGRSLTEFTLASLAVVIVLAWIAPPWVQNRERSKAAEACTYLDAVRKAQDRFLRHHGHYADDLETLDLDRPSPTHFAVGPIIHPNLSGDSSGWTLTLTRAGFSQGYGCYTVTYAQGGLDWRQSTVDRSLLVGTPLALDDAYAFCDRPTTKVME